MEKYTDTYADHLIKIEDAEGEFLMKPNRKTATALSDLKNKKFSRSDMYTTEYLAYMKQEQLVAQKQLKNCLKQFKYYLNK